MAAEVSKDLVRGGPARVGSGLGARFFYHQHNHPSEGEVGRLYLARRGGEGYAPPRGRRERAGARPEFVTRSVL